MKRRLFLQSTSAAALSGALAACGGGGGGGGSSADDGPAAGALATGVTASVASPSSLPGKILGTYYTAWDAGRYSITDIPSDFNVIYLFHCKPSGGGNNQGDGSMKFEHFDDITAEQVQACRNRGQRVILTVGGAGQGYAWDNRTKSANMVESFRAIAEQLGGVDGIDYNNFEGHIVHEGNVDLVGGEMVWIAQQLRASYGEGFAVTSPPQPNDPVQQRLMRILLDGGTLTYAAPQYYDWSGFNEPGFISNRTRTWVDLLGQEHVAIGLSANYSNGPSLDDCLREWNAVKGQYPNARGAFCWSAQHNLSGGNAWGSTMKGQL